jgi:hypothetical protein
MSNPKQRQKVQLISMEEIGKDDINFPEFCFGVIGKTDVSSQPAELVFIDKLNPDSKITITRGKYGFPNQTTRDLRLALMRLTFQKNGFTSDRVPISASEVLREMGLKKSGTSLKNLKKHLDILTDTRISFENSYYDKITNEKHTQTLKMSVLSGYQIAEISKVRQKKAAGSMVDTSFQGYILWQQDHYQNSLQNSRNLIQFDYPFYLSLNQDITKQLYLFLNKRKYNSAELRIELPVLAFEKLGISRTMEGKLYNVRYLLKQAHETLQNRGFLESYKMEKDKFSKKEFVHYFFNSKIKVTTTEPEQLPLLEADPKWDEIQEDLLSFGLTEGQAGKLFRNYSYEQVKTALELLQAQYAGKKVRNPIGLMTECLKGSFDTTALDKKKNNEAKELEEKMEAQREFEKEMKETKEKEISAKLKDEMIQKWIGQNPGSYLKLCEDFVKEEEQKESSVFYNSLRKKAQEEGITLTQALMESPFMNQMIKIKIYDQFILSKQV